MTSKHRIEAVITEAQRVLRDHGQAVTQFVTGSLQEAPIRSEPDLVFTPNSGPKAGQVWIVEVKEGGRNGLDTSHLQQAVKFREQIVNANVRIDPHFVLATTAPLSAKQREFAESKGLDVVIMADSGRTLAEAILHRVGLREEEEGTQMALKYVSQAPTPPFISVGTREVDFPSNLAPAAARVLLTMPLNNTTSHAWGEVLASLAGNAAAARRLAQRSTSDPVVFTVEVDEARHKARLEFFI